MVRVVRLERTVSWSQTRRDTNFAIPGYSISAIIPRRGRKSKIFLSVVIPVVKATFMPFSATGEKPAIVRVARICGVSTYPVPDTATALPNFARYQLRHTPIGENIQFFCQIRKWSNLWSKVFCRRTRRRKSEKTREKRRIRELSAVGS